MNDDSLTSDHVLADADSLVALAKVDDSNHNRAVKIDNALRAKGVTFSLSPFTVPEAVTVLSYKVSHQEAKRFLRQVRRINLPIMKLEDKDLFMADEWFLKQKMKGVSYFDCYNMALLEKYSDLLSAIFSFDSVYEKNGFRTVGQLV